MIMIIDCDTHLMPRHAFDGVDGEFGPRKPNLKFNNDGLYVDVEFPGYPPEVPGTSPLLAPGSGAMFKSLWDVQVAHGRLRQEAGHRAACYFAAIFRLVVLSHRSPNWPSKMARSHNEALLGLMKEYPGRILGAALVALQDVAGSIREMEWARENGFCSVVLDKVFPVKDHPYGEPLGSHRELWPFFKRAEELSMPIYLHNVQHGHRISNFPLFQRDGLYIFAPEEGQMSLVSLITSGLLDEYPRLQFIYTEAGTSFIKPLVVRLDKVLEAPPIDYADQEEPLANRTLTKVGERVAASQGPVSGPYFSREE